MNYDKPFKTFDGQIDYLINYHNLTIKDKKKAKELLACISYYDLINGYKEFFMNNEKYMNTSIEDLYYFLIFDRNIQSILFKYSVYVENHFKTILAYVISKNYGVNFEDYIKSENFYTGNINKYRSVLNNIYHTLNSDYLGNPTKHYKENKNHIPAWILLKNLTFNDCIDLFSILKTHNKKRLRIT